MGQNPNRRRIEAGSCPKVFIHGKVIFLYHVSCSKLKFQHDWSCRVDRRIYVTWISSLWPSFLGNWWTNSILWNICQALAPLLSQLSSYNGDSNPHYKKNFLRIVKIFTNNIQVTTTSFILYLKPSSQSAKSSSKWWDTWLTTPMLLRENNRSSWCVAGRLCIYLY